MRNLHRSFDWHYIEQIYGGDFAKFCGLLRIYEPYCPDIYTVEITQTGARLGQKISRCFTSLSSYVRVVYPFQILHPMVDRVGTFKIKINIYNCNTVKSQILRRLV